MYHEYKQNEKREEHWEQAIAFFDSPPVFHPVNIYDKTFGLHREQREATISHLLQLK